MDTLKNHEGNCISGCENNSNNINSGASFEQDIGGKLFEHTQHFPPYILKNTVTDISSAETSNSIPSRKTIENEEEVLGPCNLLKRISV